jgi:hypothetical protein
MMPARHANYQPDLLIQATIAVERERLTPQTQVMVIELLRQLLNECVSGAAKAELVNE